MKATTLFFVSVLCIQFGLAETALLEGQGLKKETTKKGSLPTRLGDKLVQFCKENLGKQVGEGECSHLVNAGLKASGAKELSSFEDFPDKGDYVWGELVYLREVKDGVPREKKELGKRINAGDIIQFRDAKFMGKKFGATYNRNASHHTAVVVELKKNGELAVFHQNSNKKRFVIADTYNLNDLRSGWGRIYTPVQN